MAAVPRILALAVSTVIPALAVLAAPAPGLAQGQVSQALYNRVMKSEHPTIKVYRGATNNKAYAACFDWSRGASNPAIPAGGYSAGLRSEIAARQNAMTTCARVMKERNATCSCQVIDVNGHQAN